MTLGIGVSVKLSIEQKVILEIVEVGGFARNDPESGWKLEKILKQTGRSSVDFEKQSLRGGKKRESRVVKKTRIESLSFGTLDKALGKRSRWAGFSKNSGNRIVKLCKVVMTMSAIVLSFSCYHCGFRNWYR